MARNLVKESQEDEEKAIASAVEKKEEPKENIVILTAEQVILNNLQAIAKVQDEMFLKMIAGFKQIGIKFEEKK